MNQCSELSIADIKEIEREEIHTKKFILVPSTILK